MGSACLESERALGDDRVPTFGYGWVSSEQGSEGQRCHCSPAKGSGMGGGGTLSSAADEKGEKASQPN